MNNLLDRIRDSLLGTPFEGKVWLVGGAVRDELLGFTPKADYDFVTTGSSAELARLLFDKGLSSIPPVTFERFGTAMVQVDEVQIEIVTARRESYDTDSRKPTVQPATIEEDVRRRDFTANALMRNISTGALFDPLGTGLQDLQNKVLRTPVDPVQTFHDDPLRMLRAVRFRWQLGFTLAPGLYEAITAEAERLRIISAERIRDEFVKMLRMPTAADALEDLRQLNLLQQFAPELTAMLGVEQGSAHHLDVWYHTLAVVRNAHSVPLALASTPPTVSPASASTPHPVSPALASSPQPISLASAVSPYPVSPASAGSPPKSPDILLILAALFHDVGKPSTFMHDDGGRIRFFGHESVGADITREIMRRLRFPDREVDQVVQLVANHMRLGSAVEFTPSAARRLVRDLGDNLPRLLDLVEADMGGLKTGVQKMQLEPIRERIREVQQDTPVHSLQSPLSGEEIMQILNIPAGAEVGVWKAKLLELVLEGKLQPGDKKAATNILLTTD